MQGGQAHGQHLQLRGHLPHVVQPQLALRRKQAAAQCAQQEAAVLRMGTAAAHGLAAAGHAPQAGSHVRTRGGPSRTRLQAYGLVHAAMSVHDLGQTTLAHTRVRAALLLIRHADLGTRCW